MAMASRPIGGEQYVAWWCSSRRQELPDWQLHSLALALYLTPENACVLPASRSLSALVCLVLASFQPCLYLDTQTVLSFFHDETTAGRKTGVVSRALRPVLFLANIYSTSTQGMWVSCAHTLDADCEAQVPWRGRPEWLPLGSWLLCLMPSYSASSLAGSVLVATIY